MFLRKRSKKMGLDISTLYSRMKSNSELYYTIRRAYGKNYFDASIKAKTAFLELINDLDIKPYDYEKAFFICTALALQDSPYGEKTISTYLAEIYNNGTTSKSQKRDIRKLLATDLDDTGKLLHQLSTIMKKPLKEKVLNLNYLYEDLDNWNNESSPRLRWAKTIVNNRKREEK